jgi:hypothetical protein
MMVPEYLTPLQFLLAREAAVELRAQGFDVEFVNVAHVGSRSRPRVLCDVVLGGRTNAHRRRVARLFDLAMADVMTFA